MDLSTLLGSGRDVVVARSSCVGSRHRSLLRAIGEGDEARTRDFQLGKLNFRSFIFNTHKSLKENVRACVA